MKTLSFLSLMFLCQTALSQAVGIGTTTPNASSSLDLGPSAKPLVLPRLTQAQMAAVPNPAQGMVIYNSDEHQLYGYMRYRTPVLSGLSASRWQPVTTGPRMLAWGVVDSFGTEINGSLTYSVTWDATNNWYRLSLTNPHEYFKDSMMLMVTAVGNGSWDQAVSTGELIEANGRLASIKFTDVSRIVSGFNTLESRRRSGFHFTLFDLRKESY
ncbi:MAG: hypothetical protein Q7T76_16445 [Ferruginibacter sp.]|nr:hypothetical protein [Ferruginibacter sp.]